MYIETILKSLFRIMVLAVGGKDAIILNTQDTRDESPNSPGQEGKYP